MDIELIKKKLAESGNNVDKTLATWLSDSIASNGFHDSLVLDEEDDEESGSKTGGYNLRSNGRQPSGKKPPTKIDKKRDKKQRQMERQKQKVAEQNGQTISNDIISSDASSGENKHSVSLNIFTKSI
jgi:hypothetical protein